MERCGITSSGAFVRDQILKSNFTLGKEWSISIDIKIDELSSGHTSVLRMTNTTIDGNVVGSRSPAIFVKPNTRKLSVVINANGNNWLHWSSDDIGEGWRNIKIGQKMSGDTFMYQFHVNGELIEEVANLKPIRYENFNLYVSDRFFPATKGEFRNLEFRTTLY